ncbi:hypothetical protein DID88_008994 [Monilinia fructigena]|uniref:Uncharacterized protein n=1 Tax=Monilinia fructigena TaxID=38457 RepID=A0A395IFV9_9HELO|nr:hypothetical protein DID88_008994 [Monilinia fructigena]
MSSSVGGGERMAPEVIPRPISHPPKDLESIARIDSSLIFEHFTTSDAWVLGSALRERLLPHPTPVVISISLSNANQILFHCCTHSAPCPTTIAGCRGSGRRFCAGALVLGICGKEDQRVMNKYKELELESESESE